MVMMIPCKAMHMAGVITDGVGGRGNSSKMVVMQWEKLRTDAGKILSSGLWTYEQG